MRSPLRPALVLSAWTILVWTTRIRNIWTDDSLSTSGQVGRTALAGGFTVFAVVTIAAWYSMGRHGGEPTARTRTWIRGFVVWTVGVWSVRAVQIGAADHGVAFKLVHSVLAVVSVGLALWADREANRSPRPDPVKASSSPRS